MIDMIQSPPIGDAMEGAGANIEAGQPEAIGKQPGNGHPGNGHLIG